MTLRLFKTALLPLSLALVATPVLAQSGDWSGDYIGIDIGMTGSRDGDFSADLDPARDPRLTYDVAPTATRIDRERTLRRELSGSLRAGRMVQRGSLVFGAELQAGVTDLNETFAFGPVQQLNARSNIVADVGSITSSADTLTAEIGLKASASLRARIGVPVGERVLVSAFAGPAVAHARLSAGQTSQITTTRLFFPPFGHPSIIPTTVTRTTAGAEESKAVFGGTFGGAVDYRLSDRWLVRAEAGMTFYDDIEATSGSSGGSSGGDSRVSYAPKVYALSLGLTRRF